MLKNIFLGIKAYFGAFSLISKLKLWKYFAIPMIISLVIAIIIFVSAYSFSDNIANYVSNFYPSWHTSTWIKTFLELLIGMVILVFGLIIYRHIIMALSAPFMSPISEKIESYLINNLHNNHRKTSFSQQLWRGIKINVRNLFFELLLTIPIFLLSFIPIIGVFSVVLLFLVQAYYAGFGNMDYTLERHFKYHESIQFVKKNRGLAIGNGMVFMLFLLIPVIGVILVLPLSVTAATIKTVEVLQLKNL